MSNTPSKKPNRKGKRPTNRQRLAAKLEVENISKGLHKSKKQILAEAGYPASMQTVPHKVYESMNFQELLDEFLPRSEVMAKHKSLLSAKHVEHMTFDSHVSDDEIKDLINNIEGCTLKYIKRHGETDTDVYFWAVDTYATKAAVEMAYKLRGDFTAEKLNPQNPFAGTPEEELDKLIEEKERLITRR